MTDQCECFLVIDPFVQDFQTRIFDIVDGCTGWELSGDNHSTRFMFASGLYATKHHAELMRTRFRFAGGTLENGHFRTKRRGAIGTLYYH